MNTTVFLADDHAIVRDGLRLLLESNNINVVGESSDGRNTVALVKKLVPDVVVMDISMPVMNGIEATIHIKNSCVASQVVILSMYATSEHIYRALKAGAMGYLLKESVGQELIQAVTSARSGSRYMSEKIMDTVVDDYIYLRQKTSPVSPLEKLSSREREILQLVAEGKASTDIAGDLSLSPKTIETYRSRLMQKIGINDLPGLVRFAIQHGLTPL